MQSYTTRRRALRTHAKVVSPYVFNSLSSTPRRLRIETRQGLMKMANVAEVAGDIVASGSALSGLILVYIGSLSTSFGAYQTQERRTVLGSYQRRAWFAFVGLVLFLLSALLGLVGKWLDLGCAVVGALTFLLVGFGWLLIVAVLTVREIR